MRATVVRMKAALAYLHQAQATGNELPETGGILAARFMIVNSIESVKSVLELLRQEKEETPEKAQNDSGLGVVGGKGVSLDGHEDDLGLADVLASLLETVHVLEGGDGGHGPALAPDDQVDLGEASHEAVHDGLHIGPPWRVGQGRTAVRPYTQRVSWRRPGPCRIYRHYRRVIASGFRPIRYAAGEIPEASARIPAPITRPCPRGE